MNASFLTRVAAGVALIALAVGLSAPLRAQTGASASGSEPAPVAALTANAAAFLVVEATSGQVLAESNQRARRDPASLTKLMTAYVVFDALHQKQLSLTQRLRIPERAWRAEGSRMFVEPGAPVTTEDLLRGMIVQSGNDAAIALAIAVAGNESEFVARMNREAKRLGMADTQFLNPTGLTQQGHYSTAHDLAVLSLALLRDYPQYARLFAEKSFTFGRITQPNRNRLLFTDPSVDGLKTGHTDAAGWCLIATVNRAPRRLLVVLLGAPTEAARTSEAQMLIEWAFAAWEGRRFYEAGKPVRQLRVWKASVDSVPVGFRDDVTAVTEVARGPALSTVLDIPEPRVGPLQAGDVVGTLKVLRGSELIYEREVLALESAPSAPMWKRMWHSVVLWFKGLLK